MSRREDIDVAIWSDPDFADLSGAAKLLYLWSFTNQRCGMGGMFKVPRRAILLETSLSDDQLAGALAELDAGRFLYYDGTWLWIRSRVKHLRTRTVQMCRGVAKDLAKVPADHPYRVALLDADGASVWASGDSATTIRDQLDDLEAVPQGYHPETPRTHPATDGAEPNGGSYLDTSERFLGKGKGRGKGSGGVDLEEVDARADVERLCSLLAELMVANDPKAKVAPDGKRWRDAARLLLDQDGRSLDEAERVIRFSQADDFWRANVLSMPTLREKFPQLLLKMRQRPNGRAGISASDQAAEWLRGVA